MTVSLRKPVNLTKRTTPRADDLVRQAIAATPGRLHYRWDREAGRYVIV